MNYALAIDDGPWRQNTAAITIDAATPEPVAVSKPAFGRTSFSGAPQWVEAFQRRFIELRGLLPNWDGRGSAGVRTDVLFFTYSVLGRAMAPSVVPPSIVPLGDGGVQLVWSSATDEIEVEIVKPNDVMIYAIDHETGIEREWLSTTEFSGLALLLRSKFTR